MKIILKNLSSIVFLTAILAMSSCVDKDYDLSDVSTDNITVGESFIAPVGIISFDFNRLIPGFPAGTEVPPLPYVTPVLLGLDGSIDPDIVSTLTDNGTVSMKVEVTNGLGVDVFMTMTFASDQGDVEMFSDRKIEGSKAGKAGHTEFRTPDLDAWKLDRFARATQAKIYLHTEDPFIFNPGDAIVNIKMSLIQEGGLTL